MKKDLVKNISTYMTDSSFRSPLFEKLCDVAQEECGGNFVIVYPKDDGWGQVRPAGQTDTPDFCKLIHGSKEGAKHCKMCHVLMTIAACSQGMTEQTCHAGATVLVNPLSVSGDDTVAVLSSCVFKKGNKAETWKGVQHSCKRLGLDMKVLKKTFSLLPEVDEKMIHCMRQIMGLTVEAIREVKMRAELEMEINQYRTPDSGKGEGVRSLIKNELRSAGKHSLDADEDHDGESSIAGRVPALVKVIRSLVAKHPEMSYTVEDIARAARMTPNYFSSLFRQHTGQCFMDYLTDKRIDMSKRLLGDLSINIGEVASLCGYDDPGYYTRRFKQKVGLTPREWREKNISV